MRVVLEQSTAKQHLPEGWGGFTASQKSVHRVSSYSLLESAHSQCTVHPLSALSLPTVYPESAHSSYPSPTFPTFIILLSQMHHR